MKNNTPERSDAQGKDRFETVKDSSPKELDHPLRNSQVGVTPSQSVTDLKFSNFDERAAAHYASILNEAEFLMVGFDAEWVERKGNRKVLSYQTYVLLDGVRQKGFIYFMEGEDEGKRLTLDELVGKTIRDFRKEFPEVEWPEVVVLVGHYCVSDLSALGCFERTSKRSFDSVRRTYVTLDPYSAPRYDLTKEDGSKSRVTIALRDSFLLAPQGMAKLEKLGEMLGLEKIRVSRSDKQNMDQLLLRDRSLFTRYAIRDAEVSVKYAAALAGMFVDLQETTKDECPFVPVTLASLTGVFVDGVWQREGIERESVLGKETVRISEFKQKASRYITRKKEVDQIEFEENLPVAINSYHGGWNDAYYFGFSPEEDITDFDLKSAYMAPLAMLGMPQWEDVQQSNDIEDFQYGVLGAARISFEFPESVRFPTLSVRTASDSLIRPRKFDDKEARRKGHPFRAYATATEIALARKLGAKITIHSGFIVPCDDSVRPFEKVVEQGLALRERHAKEKGKGCAEELLVKELLNSIYGKTAQGLRRTRGFDAKSGEHKDLKPHWLTQPYIAGFITGMIRASLGEIANSLPEQRTIYTITTDGFLTNSTEEEVANASQGAVCELLRAARERTAGNRDIIEVKHRARQVLVWRRRSGASVQVMKGAKPLVAKAGLKTPVRWSERFEVEEEYFDERCDCQWIIGKFVRRFAGQKVLLRRMPSLYELYHEHIGPEDFVEVKQRKQLRMDYDFGQMPVKIGNQSFRWRGRKQSHVRFYTKPWKTLEEYQRARDEWNQWSLATGRIMKSKKDVEDFMNRFSVPPTKGMNRRINGGPISRAVKVFARAYCHEQMGLKIVRSENEAGTDDSKDLARVFLVAILAAVKANHPSCRSEIRKLLGHGGKKKLGQNLIENSSREETRAPLRSVPRTPETEEFVRRMKGSLWGKALDTDQFFAP